MKGGTATKRRGSTRGIPARVLEQWILLPLEWLFAVMAGSRPVPGSRATFLVAQHRYHGQAVHLPDGTSVRPGDGILEIHFWNRQISRRQGPSAQDVTWTFIRDLRTDFETLARLMAAGKIAQRARAIYGASPVAHGATRFGFWVRPLPRGLRSLMLTRWQQLLRSVYRPPAVQTKATEDTVEMWMAREEFIRRFAVKGRPRIRRPVANESHKGVSL